jgi:hypothetical protein
VSVGGTVVDIVRRSPERWWINTFDERAESVPAVSQTVAVWCDPNGEPIEVGDSLWWQGDSCYWTPVDRSRQDVRLPKIGYSHSGTEHPECAKEFQ